MAFRPVEQVIGWAEEAGSGIRKSHSPYGIRGRNDEELKKERPGRYRAWEKKGSYWDGKARGADFERCTAGEGEVRRESPHGM
jgi:hypothetical protein